MILMILKACFSVVPEHRYEVTNEYLDSIWNRGFEVIVQDLNHDGRLFRNRKDYLSRVERINAYGRSTERPGFGPLSCIGTRSGLTR